MTYPTIDASESPADGHAPGALASGPSARERLHAALMLAGLLSVAAAFWIAVWRLAVA